MDLLNKLETAFRKVRGNHAPVAVALGLILLSAGIGIYTVKQQLLYSPDVFVDKRRRETIPEVKEPDYVADRAHKFFKKSLFRRIAHVQDPVRDENQVVPDTIRGDPLKQQRPVECLKEVGVEPSGL